jgi:NAD(P)-dependent dehydrogenase (short-subunit alcohol dehydrogenase family)
MMNFDNLFSVRGKVALVTGGSRGIGEMIAAGFVAGGAKVYISSRKAETCEATAQRISQEQGGTCIALPADLSRMDGVYSLAERLKALEPARHPGQQRRRRLGRADRVLPRGRLGQGDGHQREGGVLPDPATAAAAARGRCGHG